MASRQVRSQLAVSAFEILKDNLERLWGKIHNQAPNATRRSVTNTFQCTVGPASLYVDLSRRDPIGLGVFNESGWDVICTSQIKVAQEQPKYVWSSSLWYMKLPQTSEYRWHEVSYWNWQQSEYQPFGTSDCRSADIAASKIMSALNIAFGPALVDDEKEDEFHNRWIWLFAQAVEGKLRLPRTLPITDWPPQYA